MPKFILFVSGIMLLVALPLAKIYADSAGGDGPSGGDSAGGDGSGGGDSAGGDGPSGGDSAGGDGPSSSAEPAPAAAPDISPPVTAVLPASDLSPPPVPPPPAPLSAAAAPVPPPSPPPAPPSPPIAPPSPPGGGGPGPTGPGPSGVTPSLIVLRSEARPAFFVTLRQVPITGIGDDLSAFLFLLVIAGLSAAAAQAVLTLARPSGQILGGSANSGVSAPLFTPPKESRSYVGEALQIHLD
ncbi:MAG: hypothetical protein HY474_01430 [Candidatus Sungbacteria bacterium]|uniref:Uncharacterized protein n=1 Tax=Candidatus Sungiibacteriota bacterium TaxID=2750080 RepID=A0A932YVR3_9BACT|nr:hypothetical protein [Candidatus Sungbacteria bacterium]